MRIKKIGSSIKIWFSATDTYNWSHRPEEVWPCSTLSGKSIFVEFDGLDIVDFQINGGRGQQDCDFHELRAMMQDLVKE